MGSIWSFSFPLLGTSQKQSFAEENVNFKTEGIEGALGTTSDQKQEAEPSKEELSFFAVWRPRMMDSGW